MQVGIEFGREHLDVVVRDQDLVGVRRPAQVPALSDPQEAVRQALETPHGYSALRRALTPDDHVVIVLDDRLPARAELLAPLLDHITGAHVSPRAITLLCPSADCRERWAGEVPGPFRDVPFEVHDPTDRRHLSYLATTRKGRRIYLNRTAVDADQLVVLTRRAYDPLLGYSGSEGALYPVLSDEATRAEMGGRLSMDVPGEEPWPVRQEATEVAWLLGAPFLIQIIDGAGEEIAHVVGGTADSSREGARLLDARWRTAVDRPADTVVAAVGGDPARHGFADLASALACAARVVRPNGRIVLLSRAAPALGAGAELLRQSEDPERALAVLPQSTPPDQAAAFQWANAVQQATVYLLSDFPPEVAEELFTTPLEHAGQVQRLLDANGSCLVLPDAHKMLATV